VVDLTFTIVETKRKKCGLHVTEKVLKTNTILKRRLLIRPHTHLLLV
jgi:hypothetical protein